MNKFNDNDIREALRRSEAKRQPAEVPDDFFANVMGKIEAETESEHKTIKLWRWVAAAACIAVVAGIGTAILFADKTIQDKGMTARIEIEENTEIQQPTTVKTDTVTEPAATPEPKDEAPKQKAKPKPAPNPNLRMERPQYAENEPSTVVTDNEPTNNANQTNYAEYQTENDETNFTPAMMDEFIEIIAEFQGVNKTNSECTIANDTNFVESFYVFPVKKDYNVLEQIAWMAGNYSNTTPGYIFNNTDRQILFSIDDEPNGINYLWIAEQIDDSKIMIYCVHAPIDIEYESDCYQQFYDNLTFANFNTYY